MLRIIYIFDYFSLIFDFICLFIIKQKNHHQHLLQPTIMQQTNQQHYSNSQLRKRIKTQDISARTSPKISRQYQQYKPPKIIRLPTVNIKNNNKITYKNSLHLINQEDSSDLKHYKEHIEKKRNSASIPYSKRLQLQRSQKLFDQLCQPLCPQSHSLNLKMSNIQITQHSVQKLQKYVKVRQLYQDMRKSKKTKDVQCIINFINTLKTFNVFYTKVDQLLSLILMKRGQVYQFQENCVIYNQNQLIDSALLILWGDVKLKQIYRNKVKYCIPGDILCQQVVMEQKRNKKLFSEIDFVKGSFITGETAKAQTKCGVLEITKQVYNEIKGKFCENGHRDKILTFQRLLMWSLSKKMKLRK